MEYGCLIGIIIAVMGVAGLIAMISFLSRSNVTKHFEQYKHHGDEPVWVRSDLKGEHRDHCLCYDCKRFHPGTAANCTIAHAIYKNCVLHNVVTPVWECPRFAQEPNVTYAK